MAQQIQGYLKERMPEWKETHPGAEELRVAVMGCVVNGPGESKHADIGISLPGTFEAPVAPVFIDGKLDRTLARGWTRRRVHRHPGGLRGAKISRARARDRGGPCHPGASRTVTARRPAPPLPVLLSLAAAAALAFGCGSAAPVVGTTFPPAVPTRTVDPEKVIAGLKKELGPDSPIRFKATADAYVDDILLKLILDGDFQGNEMDGHIKYQAAGLQLSFHIIAADGKAYVKPYKGKWAKSPEKVPPDGSGPFGDMSTAKLEFKGVSKTDRDLYTVVWTGPTHAGRALDGTLFTAPRSRAP